MITILSCFGYNSLCGWKFGNAIIKLNRCGITNVFNFTQVDSREYMDVTVLVVMRKWQG